MKFFQTVKEIRSRHGVLHFTRYAIFQTALLSLYIHKIYKADEDDHLHSHPWNFVGVVLKGTYIAFTDPLGLGRRYISTIKDKWCWTWMTRKDFHKIWKICEEPVTTLVLCYGQRKPWYYLVGQNDHVESTEYRRRKNQKNVQEENPYR